MDTKICTKCEGRGEVPKGVFDGDMVTCPECWGSGYKKVLEGEEYFQSVPSSKPHSNGPILVVLAIAVAVVLILAAVLSSSDNFDTDGDGYRDYEDDFPDDPKEWIDSDNDGVGDLGDPFPRDPLENKDTDSDGIGDNSDIFPDDQSEWEDSDSDGIGDNQDNDDDDDGYSDSADEFPLDPGEWSDADGDGIGDNTDEYTYWQITDNDESSWYSSYIPYVKGDTIYSVRNHWNLWSSNPTVDWQEIHQMRLPGNEGETIARTNDWEEDRGSHENDRVIQVIKHRSSTYVVRINNIVESSYEGGMVHTTTYQASTRIDQVLTDRIISYKDAEVGEYYQSMCSDGNILAYLHEEDDNTTIEWVDGSVENVISNYTVDLRNPDIDQGKIVYEVKEEHANSIDLFDTDTEEIKRLAEGGPKYEYFRPKISKEHVVWVQKNIATGQYTLQTYHLQSENVKSYGISSSFVSIQDIDDNIVAYSIELKDEKVFSLLDLDSGELRMVAPLSAHGTIGDNYVVFSDGENLFYTTPTV